MSKGTRTLCKGHGGYFNVKPGEEWKFLCKKCYIQYYVPMSKKYSHKELRDNWDVLFAEYKAEKAASSAHAFGIIRQIMEDAEGDCINPY